MSEIRTLAEIGQNPGGSSETCCANCRFGIWAPVGRRRHSEEYAHQCTFRPPTSPMGFPVVRHYAVCAMFTEKDAPYNQPLRHLMPCAESDKGVCDV